MLSSDIRTAFLRFFENNGHKIVDSSSVVPQNDPSLLFTNAGMVQFKNIFTGLESREYKRATTSQKCIRAGGKHNDLDQVGFTARHHTFFEMLGNFSFGDYFKEEAIYFAWTFLTRELGLKKERMLATIYHTDEEAKTIWKKIAGDITIIPISTADNFWSMGDVGPCGPCSEIFYDHGDKVFGGMPGSPDQDGDRYMEIWNIVFMQFEQINGEKIPLQKKSIDTGMGLERIAGIMQNVSDNYLIDLFRNIINEVKIISKTNFEDTYPSYKVIADHIRSASFLISDGVLPSNEGRGYVLRRILRRAMRHGNLINVKEPFLFRLTNLLVDAMKDAYPELEKSKAMVTSTIHMEEEKFLSTLDRGLKILQNDLKEIPDGGVLSGEKAFKLYDTYGFPLDLTQDILKAENISVNVDEFGKALQEQKNRAKWIGSGEAEEAQIWHTLKEKIKSVEFVGYQMDKCSSEIIAIVSDEKSVKSISSGSKAFLITKATPFYAECGGQCGDVGLIKGANGIFRVNDTKKFCDTLIVHEGEVLSGCFEVHANADLEIDAERRQKIKANHTAAHLLQAALRLVLGEHVAQRGSSLNEERLRFDFSHIAAVSTEEIEKIEGVVNGWILQNMTVSCKTMAKNEAIAAGATALFGEKYGEFVRTVAVTDKNDPVSFELCGGTHAASTGCIGLFKILSESSIGSGIRRIEAITGQKVLEYLRQSENTIDAAAEKLKCNPAEISRKIDDLLAELKRKKQEISQEKQRNALKSLQKTVVHDVEIYSLEVSNSEIDELRSLNEAVKSHQSPGIVIIANHSGDKILLMVSVTANLQKKYNAGQLLKIGLVPLNGKGGGNAAFAQGGGTGEEEKIATAISAIINSLG
ncbi:MAG: alanine--tRNA ligase [Holosporaceae bacterium]|jgi:alanyl-tRNA synthetase|nr:alanine--tRNA ligase [Holosporaceae bacterium]